MDAGSDEVDPDRGCSEPSELGDGKQDHHRLLHHDEQRAGGERGAMAVRYPPGKYRTGDPSGENHTLQRASITSSPLFIMVEESMVILFPISQFGWFRAS